MFLKKIVVGGATLALMLSGAVTANATPPNAPVLNNYCTLSTNVPESSASDKYNTYVTLGQGDCPSYIFDYSTGVWGDVAQPAAPTGLVLTRAALGNSLVAESGNVRLARRYPYGYTSTTPVDIYATSGFSYNTVPSNFWPCGSLDCAGTPYVDPFTSEFNNSNWNGNERSESPSGAYFSLRNWADWSNEIAGTYLPSSEYTFNYAELYNAEKDQVTRWNFTFNPFVIKRDTSVAVTSAKKSNGKLSVKTRMDFGQGYYQCDVANKAAVGGSDCTQGVWYFKSYAELYRDGKLIKTVKMNPNTGIAKFKVKAKKGKHVYVVKSYFQDQKYETYKTAEATFTK